MYKKVLAILLALAMVMSTSMIVMAGEGAEAEAADAEDLITGAAFFEILEEAGYTPGDEKLAEALEALFGEMTEEGAFDPEDIGALRKGLFTGYGEEEEEERDVRLSDLFDIIDIHLMEETSEYLEPGDETVVSYVFGDFDEQEDGTLQVLGYFTILNYDADEESPEDLLLKNGAGLIELMTLELNEDGEYEVTDCFTAEDGDTYTDSIEEMCELIGTDPDAFYERLGICALAIASDLHNFLEETPEYEHIEYMGELVSHEDLEDIVDELFYDYLALYGLDGLVEDADAADGGEDQVDDTSVNPERFLAGTIIFDAILEAAMNVDLEGKRAAGTELPEDGHVFSLLEDVMTEISEISSEDGLEDEETLSQVLYGLTSLGEDDEISEEELDDLLGLMLLAGEAKNAEMESEEVDIPSNFMAVGDFAVFVIAAVEDNEVIAEAVEATDSSLFEILESFIDENKENPDTRDALFEELEVELEKVTDYINTMEGRKGAALDLLNLIHTIADELHAFYYGHTHEIAEEAE